MKRNISILFVMIILTTAFGIVLQSITLRFILFRIESLYFACLTGLFYYYTMTLTSCIFPSVQHLASKDLRHLRNIETPKFLDLGFKDIHLKEHYWLFKHKAFSYSAHQGWRTYMEDRMHYLFDPNMNLSIFAIFDGHGGQFVSDYLEAHFAKRVRERLLKFDSVRRAKLSASHSRRDPVEQAIITEVHKFDDAISRLDRTMTSTCGSTLIAAILEDNRFLTVVSVGDSRAVACDANGKAKPMSRDHKPMDPKEKRRIESAGGFITSYENDADRVQGILAVARSFGDTYLKDLGVLTAHPSIVRLDLREEKLQFLIVATDGFWDVISNEEAVKFSAKFLRMPSAHQMCALIRAGTNITPEVLASLPHDAPLSSLNRITYAYIAPVIIAVGIVGDVLTVVTLTHPLLRKSSIIYTYLTLLAMTDLLTQLSVVPMVMWLLDIRYCSHTAAFFYAHIGFPLANALMGSSVWIVVFLTLSQYMAVCRPFAYGLRSRKVCFVLFILSYAFNFCIYAPWATKKEVHQLDLPEQLGLCPYQVCDAKREHWFVLYEWIRETISRVFPFFLVAFLNAKILITYRHMKVDRMRRMANSQKRFVFEKSEKEEKRLFILLFAIIIIFFLCTIPAAPLTILVADAKSGNFPFQIFRAVVNLLEFTKFALNFYFYCLINPDIRRICAHVVMCKKLSRPARVKGQPVTPISLYTRSTKCTVRNGSSRRSSSKEDQRRNSAARQRQVAQADALIEKLTVIKESDDSADTMGDKV